MKFHPRALSYEQLRIEAEIRLDEHHAERTPPVPVDDIVEFDLGIVLVPIEGLKSDIRVDAFLSSDLSQLFVDCDVMMYSPLRYRFSLAHELAHYWLHRPLYQECAITSVAEWKAVQQAIGEFDYPRFESQANNFAGLFLVPGDPLRKAFRAECAKLQSAGIQAERVQHHPTRAYVVNSLASQFEVSEQSMEIRLERDGLLSKVGGF